MQIKKLEIWMIDFDPSTWNEIKKKRPAIVISNTYYNIASWTIFVIPLSSQFPKNDKSPFHIKIIKDKKTNLDKDSYANISQFRSISKLRFIDKIWEIEEIAFNEIINKFLSIVQFNKMNIKLL